MRKYRYIILLIIIATSILSSRTLAQFPEDPEFASSRGFYLGHIILFTEDSDKSRLRLFASVIFDDLTFLKNDGEFRAEYKATFSVVDENGKYIDSKRISRTLTTTDYFRTNSRNDFDRLTTNFDLNPGDYTVIFEFIDRESRESHQQELKVNVPSIGDSDMIISGPILLDSVMIADDGGIDLHPGVSGKMFDGGKNIWVYFEVYSKIFPVQIDIIYTLLDDKGQERISGNFQRQIENPVLRDKFRLDIDQFNFGQYKLVLKAVAGNKSTQKSRTFRIHFPGLPPSITNLEEAIDQLRYIATEREIVRMKEYYQTKRLDMFVKFWTNWAQGDEIEGYKLMEEYYRRIWESNKLFSEGGWKSDRGHVYLIHGPPSEVDRHPYDLYSKAYEIWYYLEENKRFVFVDEGGFGDYRLQSPFWGGN